jgi:hypothetical protein
MLLKAVPFHVGIPTLDLVEHPEESEDTGWNRKEAVDKGQTAGPG